MLEGQMQVVENPHSDYSLTDNIERMVENKNIYAEESSKQKVDLQFLPTVPTWIRQVCLSYYRKLLYLQRKDCGIPLNFRHNIFLKRKHSWKIEADLLGRTKTFGFYCRFT